MPPTLTLRRLPGGGSRTGSHLEDTLQFEETKIFLSFWKQKGERSDQVHTEEQQTVLPAQEPLGEVLGGEDSVRTNELRQKAAHLQLKTLGLAWTWGRQKNKKNVSLTLQQKLPPEGLSPSYS